MNDSTGIYIVAYEVTIQELRFFLISEKAYTLAEYLEFLAYNLELGNETEL